MKQSIYDIAIAAALAAGEKILEVYHGEDFQVSEKDDRSPLTLADRLAHDCILGFLARTGLPVLSEEGRGIPYAERSDWETFWLVDPLDGTKEFIKRNGEFTVNIALVEKGVPIYGVVYAPVDRDLYVGKMNEGAWRLKDPGSDPAFETCRMQGEVLPLEQEKKPGDAYKVVASRSHLNEETLTFIKNIEEEHGTTELVTRGSSLKICMVASGEADEYPRLGPTMEWDTAAAHAVVLGAGKTVTIAESGQPLTYNKENLLNPWFIVK